MNARIKKPPTEADELQAMTSGAHEALTDLRAAIREARSLRAEITTMARTLTQEHAALLTAEGTEKLDSLAIIANSALTHLQEQVGYVTGHLDDLLGTADREGLAQVIIEAAAASVASQVSAELKLPPGAKIVTRLRDTSVAMERPL